MANIKGKGGLAGRNLVGTAVYFDGKTGKDGQQMSPFYMVDAQLDMRDPRNEPATQTNPHLESHSFTASDGSSRTAHHIRMTIGQVQAIQAAAGDGNFRSLTDDNRNVEFAVKADLMFKKRPDGRKTLLIDSKGTMAPSDFGWTAEMMKNQGELKAAAQAAVAAEKSAAAAKQAEGPVQATAAEPAEKPKKTTRTRKPKAAAKPAVEAQAPEAEAAEFEA